MTFPRYPDYRDSGVEWLGEVPGHWVLKKVKYVASFSGGGTPSRDNMAYWNGDIPWVSPKDMKTEEIQGAEECITDEGLANSTSSLVAPGTVLMVVRSGILKHTIPIAINQVEAALNQDMKALTFQPDLCLPRFFLRWVQGLNDELLLAWAKQGATVESVEQEYLANTAIPLPSLPEQSTIAAFLDRETGKIDALVAEQEKLIALLKEKRQAVISHAVTKGLDPSAPMKDSGIEWLGEVPAHWDRVQLGRLCRQVSDGPHFSPEYVDDGVMFLSARNIRVDGWSLDDAKYVSESDYQEFCKRVVPEKGDVLYTKGGTTGIARVVDLDERFQVWVHVAVLKLYADLVQSAFLAYALNSTGCYEQSQLHTRGATNQDLGLTRMVKIWLALPPPAEQSAIVAHLDDQAAKFDTLIAEAQRAIGLLKEHRSALISAAVTGKIDVRGLVPAPEAAA
jgi:type I restriction enzyme S subunit